MDYWKALDELHKERERLNNVIAVLEAMHKPGVGRRGRKLMPPQERLVVAERMREYWARRKNSAFNGAGGKKE